MIAENLWPIGALILVLLAVYALLRRRDRPRRAERRLDSTAPSARGGLFRPSARKDAPRWIVVDGSNVMHWDGGTPKIETVRAVLAELLARGYTPGVVFDANAGYLLTGRYRHDHALGRMLDLPEDRVMVVPKGTVADTIVLAAAKDLSARIVTNDRYRDWSDAYPEVLEPGFLIRGGVRDGVVWVG